MLRSIILCAGTICLLAAGLHAQQFKWVSQVRSENQTRTMNIVADNQGHIYVSGVFQGEMRMEGITCKSDFPISSFVAKYNEDGTLIWVRTTRFFSSEGVYAMTRDPRSGCIYAAGFREYPNNSKGPFFITKLDSSGTLLWDKTIDTGGGGESLELAVNADGNLVMSGCAFLSAAFDGNFLKPGLFTAMMNSDGEMLWYSAAMEDAYPFHSSVEDIATDAENNTYVIGDIDVYDVPLDSTHVIRAGATERMYLVKYDENGVVKWVRNSIGPKTALAMQLGIDDQGNIHVVGSFDSMFVLGDTTISNDGNMDGFIAKLDGSGNVLRLFQAGGPGDDLFTGIAEGDDGCYFVTGTAAKNARFGDHSLEKGGAFLARCSWTGDFDYVVSGYPSSDLSRAMGARVAVTHDGKMFMTGSIRRSCIFEPFSLNGGITGNSFLARVLGPAMTEVHQEQTVPTHVTISSNYPNPFNSQTTLNFALPIAAHVTLDITDARGRLIVRALDTELIAGGHSLTWDAGQLPDGVYFAILRTGESTVLRAMTLLR
jgi:hypothetical protein